MATTRPETILADVALAVHPEDTRYHNLIGKRVQHPLLPDKSIPIIADDRVLRDLGTGVLKITPAHDFTDYEIGKEHGLALDVTCLDETGSVTDEFVTYAGMNRFQVGIFR